MKALQAASSEIRTVSDQEACQVSGGCVVDPRFGVAHPGQCPPRPDFRGWLWRPVAYEHRPVLGRKIGGKPL